MGESKMIKYSVIALLIIAALISSCADTTYSDPKQVVIALFGAMEKDDKAALARLIDLKTMMENVDQDYALNTDNPRTFVNPENLLEDLTGDGLTKTRWFSYQRIINKAEIYGETATVEVTFVDKENSQGYMTKFGLHLMNGKWKIYSFKIEDEPNSNSEY